MLGSILGPPDLDNLPFLASYKRLGFMSYKRFYRVSTQVVRTMLGYED